MIHEVYVPAFSVLTLICATIVILVLAALEINKGGDDDTKEMYMFAFASVNAGIDTVCITMFYQRKDDVLHRRFPTIIGDDMSETTESTITVPPKQPILRSANINMFSAFTHIGCDTLRTLAIFLSAIVSSTTGTKSSLCDAWAAVVVSITIFIAVIPLSLEVYAAYTGKR